MAIKGILSLMNKAMGGKPYKTAQESLAKIKEAQGVRALGAKWRIKEVQKEADKVVADLEQLKTFQDVPGRWHAGPKAIQKRKEELLAKSEYVQKQLRLLQSELKNSGIERTAREDLELAQTINKLDTAITALTVGGAGFVGGLKMENLAREGKLPFNSFFEEPQEPEEAVDEALETTMQPQSLGTKAGNFLIDTVSPIPRYK